MGDGPTSLEKPSAPIENSERAARAELAAKWVCVALAALLCAHAAISCSYWPKGTHDQAVYWMAGSRMASGEATLYEAPQDESNMVGAYIYPPAFAAMFAPITLLPRTGGEILWAVLQLAFLAGSVCCFLAWPGARSWRLWAWVCLTLLWPIMATISAGQVNSLVLLLCVAGWRDIAGGKWLRGALFLALGAHVKILPVALLPVLLVQRRFKAAAAMVVLGFALFALPLVWTIPAKGLSQGMVAAWDVNVAYGRQLVMPRLHDQFGTDVGGAAEGNLALSAALDRWAGGPGGSKAGRSLRWLGFVAALCMYGFALLSASRNHDPNDGLKWWGLCLAAAMLGNVLAWPAHLVLMALFLVPALSSDHRRAVQVAALTFIAFFNVPALLAYQLFLPQDVYDMWSGVQAAGLPTALVILLWLCAMRARTGSAARANGGVSATT